MSSRGPAVLLGVVAAGLVGLIVSAAVDRRDLAYTPGVPVLGIVAAVPAGEKACQRSLHVPYAFRAVKLVPKTLTAPNPPLQVKVSVSGTGERLGRGNVAGGYPGGVPVVAHMARVPGGRDLDVCVINRGRVTVGLKGGKAESVPDSRFTAHRQDTDAWALSLEFLRGQPRSVLSQVPTMFRRAALFRPGIVGAWTFWALALLVALGVPLLVARALRDVEGVVESAEPGPGAARARL